MASHDDDGKEEVPTEEGTRDRDRTGVLKKLNLKYEACKEELLRVQTELLALRKIESAKATSKDQDNPEETEIQKLRDIIKDKFAENQKLVDEREKLNERTKLLLRKYKELKKRLSGENGIFPTPEKQNAEEGDTSEIVHLKTQLNELKSSHRTETEKMKQQIETLHSALEKREDLLKQQENSSKELDSKNKALSRELEKIIEEKRALQEELDKFHVNIISSELKNEETITSLESADRAVGELRETRKLVKKMQGEALDRERIIQSQENELKDLKEQYESSLTKLEHLNMEIDTNNFNKMLEPNVAPLNGEDTSKSKLNVLTEKIDFSQGKQKFEPTKRSLELAEANKAVEEAALEMTKSLLLCEMLEAAIAEKNHVFQRAESAEIHCKEMERRGIELSKKFAQKYKAAKIKLQRETQAHVKTRERIQELEETLRKQAVDPEREELAIRLTTLQESLTELATKTENAEKEKQGLLKQIEAYEAECKKHEKLLERKVEVETQLEKQRCTLEKMKERERELSLELDEYKREITKYKELLSQECNLPSGFVAQRDILCAVTVRDIVWVCIDIVGDSSPGTRHTEEKLKWFCRSDVLNHMNTTNPGGKNESCLPVPLEIQFRMENDREIQAAQSETATALAELENMRGQLAQYKRRAQVALKKAQEEFGQEMNKKIEKQETSILQLQTELVRTTENRDKIKKDFENLHSEKREIQAKLQSSETSCAKLSHEVEELKGSLRDQLASLTKTLESRHDTALKEERMEFEKQYSRLRDQIKNHETRAHRLSDEVEDLQRQLIEERETSEKLRASFEATSTLQKSLEDKIEAKNVEIDTLEKEIAKVRASKQNQKHLIKNDQSGQANEMKDPSVTELYSIPLFFDGLRKQQEEERVAWQKERCEFTNRFSNLEQQKEDMSCEIERLKDELEEEKRRKLRQNLQASTETGEQTMTYLKNIVYRFVSAKEQSERRTLLPVLATMLQFSAQEINSAQRALEEQNGIGPSWLGF